MSHIGESHSGIACFYFLSFLQFLQKSKGGDPLTSIPAPPFNYDEGSVVAVVVEKEKGITKGEEERKMAKKKGASSVN